MDIKINEEETLSRKKMVAFELPDSWYKVLKDSADKELVSVSNLIRIILYKNYLEEKLNNRKEND